MVHVAVVAESRTGWIWRVWGARLGLELSRWHFFLFRIMSNWKTWKKNEVYATSYAWLCELFKVMCSFAVVLLKSSVFTYISPILALPVPRRHQRLVHPKQNSGKKTGMMLVGMMKIRTPDSWRYLTIFHWCNQLIIYCVMCRII